MEIKAARKKNLTLKKEHTSQQKIMARLNQPTPEQKLSLRSTAKMYEKLFVYDLREDTTRLENDKKIAFEEQEELLQV